MSHSPYRDNGALDMGNLADQPGLLRAALEGGTWPTSSIQTALTFLR